MMKSPKTSAKELYKEFNSKVQGPGFKEYMKKRAKQDLDTASKVLMPVPMKKPNTGKIVKALGKGATVGAIGKAAGKMAGKSKDSFQMGGKKMVLDRGRWKESINRGSQSAKKGAVLGAKLGKSKAVRDTLDKAMGKKKPQPKYKLLSK